MNAKTLYRTLFLTAMIVLAGICIVPVAADDAGQAAYAPDHIIVRFQDNADSNGILAASPAPVGILRDFSDMVSGLQVIQLPEGFPVEEAIAYYSSLPGVVYAEPDYYVSINSVPDDPEYEWQWGLNNPSSWGGVSAEDAWDITTGDDSIVVAVIDTGVDIDHPDLKQHIWTNPGEIPGNGKDDDGNGYVDDVHGWNFFLNNNDVTDYNGHGTHCSGIVGAVANNGYGVAGTAWDVTIMPVAVMNILGSGSGMSIIGGITYAVKNKADILSMSFGGSGGFSQAYKDVIDYAEKNGVLLVVSAGNENNDNDVNPAYPASFPNDNIISVAANDDYNDRTVFSNYGATTVDIAAPGLDIYSTIPDIGMTPGEMNPAISTKFAQLGNAWHTYMPEEGTVKRYFINGVNSSVLYYTEPIVPAREQFLLKWGIDYNLTQRGTLQYLVSIKDFSEYGTVEDMLKNESKWYVFGSNRKLETTYGESWTDLWSNIKTKLPSTSGEYYVGIYYNSTSADDWADMYRTTIGNDYYIDDHTFGDMSGTSMSAPMVAGAAALVKSVNPYMTPSQIRELFIATADKLDQWEGLVVSGGRLNIAAAVKAALPHRGHSASLPKDYTPSSSVPVMVQETVKPTTAPTLAAPTVMSTTKPTTQATQKSPAPLAGLIAGLGVAALLIRMRR